MVPTLLEVVVVLRNPGLAASWPALLDRLQTRRTWSSWVAVEPALARVAGPAELERTPARGVSVDTADAVLGALVRLAAADGGDEADAVLLLLHLLADGAAVLARNIEHRTQEPMTVVMGELTCQIRRFPWGRRTRAIAANLLLDTKNALWFGEFKPAVVGSCPDRAVPIDPVVASGLFDRADATLDDFDDCGRSAWTKFAKWATDRDVATTDDVMLLWDVQRRMDSGQMHQVAARDYGVSESTLRRRRNRTLRALRAYSAAYLAAVA